MECHKGLNAAHVMFIFFFRGCSWVLRPDMHFSRRILSSKSGASPGRRECHTYRKKSSEKYITHGCHRTTPAWIYIQKNKPKNCIQVCLSIIQKNQKTSNPHKKKYNFLENKLLLISINLKPLKPAIRFSLKYTAFPGWWFQPWKILVKLDEVLQGSKVNIRELFETTESTRWALSRSF